MRAVQLGATVASCLALCIPNAASGASGVPAVVQRKVDVAGVRLHVAELGAGAPTVVFVAGTGKDLSTWDKVQPRVAGVAHTLSYDRAGLGGSDPSVGPRTVSVASAGSHSGSVPEGL